MLNPKQWRSPTVLPLFLAGLISGLLNIALSDVGGRSGFPLLFPGLIFGLCISGVILIRIRPRSVSKAAALVLTSSIAYPIAFFTAVGVEIASSRLGLSGANDNVSVHALFVGGIIGAFVIFSGTLLLFRTDVKGARLLIRGLSWSLAGGALAVTGWWLGSSLGMGLWSLRHALQLTSPGETAANAVGEMSQSFSLQVVWQAGVAATLGFLLDKKSPSEEVESRASSANAREPKANLSLARKTTFACLFALLAWFVARAVTINYAAAERQRKIEDAMKNPPSLEGLPEIQMVPVDDKIVLKEIDGFGPVLPFSRRMAGSPQFGQYSGEPPTIIYSVRYYNGQPATLLEPDPGVAVTITQYPNAQWVNYRLKDVPVPNASVMYAKYIQRVTKFENAILEDTGWRYPDGHGDLYFYWPSQNDLVVVVFGTRQVDEEFLRVYLKKHPSSL